MKKLVSILIVAVLVLAMACPAMAASDSVSANEFVPSISYKGAPEIVKIEDADGNACLGAIYDADGNVAGYIAESDIVISAVSDEDASDLLTGLYSKLVNGEVTLPYEKHMEGLDASNMTVRDLLQIEWTGESKLAEGQTLSITFNLGVVADAEIYVMTYDADANEWSPIVSVVNNGDGTVTCTFAHFCAVEISARTGEVNTDVGGDQGGDSGKSNAWIWWVVGIVVILAGAGAAFYFLYYKKKIAK